MAMMTSPPQLLVNTGPPPLSPIATTMQTPFGPTTKVRPPVSPLLKRRGDYTSPRSPASPCVMKRRGGETSRFLFPSVADAPAQSTTIPMSSAQPQSQKKVDAAKSKRKLGPGRGLMGWIRLCRSGKDLTSVGKINELVVTERELAKHNTPDDAWTAIRGKVYNITPYMKFHPGGADDLMLGAGKDCTILFDEAHKWVNVESMLSKCLVGVLAPPSPETIRRNSASIVKRSRADSLKATAKMLEAKQPSPQRRSSMEMRLNEAPAASEAMEETDGRRQVSPDSPLKSLVQELPGTRVDNLDNPELEGGSDSSVMLQLPAMRKRKNSDASKPNPRFDWVQSERTVVIHIMTHCQTLKPSDVVLDVNGKCFEAAVFINDWVYQLEIALSHTIVASQVAVNGSRIDLTLTKEVPHHQWETLGSFLPGHGRLTSRNKREPRYHECRLESIRTVTHDTKLFSVRLSPGSFLSVPTGHHVSIKANIDGEEVERSYTPVAPLNSHQKQGETIDFMIKLYENGCMSQHLSRLAEGDIMWVSDPEGTFDASKLSTTTNVVLIAAGSGFTPMVKIMRDLAQAQEPRTERSTTLLFANKAEKDIMWKEELEQLLRTSHGFEVVNVLSAADNTWPGVRGRIASSLIRRHLPPAPSTSDKDKTLVCVCGPTAFTTSVSNALLDMEIPDECIHCFM